MDRYSVAAAKAHLSEILARVEEGCDVLITRRGRPVARLSPLEEAKRPIDWQQIDALRDSLTPSRRSAAALVRRLRDARY